MTDRPILFSAPMIRALLDGRKTQTRRLAWGKPMAGLYESCGGPLVPICKPTIWQSVKTGDRLWARETWQDWCPIWNGYWCGCGSKDMQARTHRPAYRATPDERGEPNLWKPSIHMPRWASRLTLLVTATKRERVQEISSAAAIAEGFSPYANSLTIDCNTRNPRDDFKLIWQSLYTKPGARWEDNPDICAISFKCIHKNIDEVLDVKAD